MRHGPELADAPDPLPLCAVLPSPTTTAPEPVPAVALSIASPHTKKKRQLRSVHRSCRASSRAETLAGAWDGPRLRTR